MSDRSTIARRIFAVPRADVGFAALEGLRAYAAFLIFLVHYWDRYATRVLGVDLNTLRLSTVPDLGTGMVYWLFASHYGVDLFFFLSGFLICKILSRPSFEYGRFLMLRFARIYPAFVLSLTVWVYVRVAVQRWYALDAGQLAGNLLFLNAVPGLGVTPYNTVTWSLFFEFVFYLSFPAVLALHPRRRVTPGAIVVFAALFMPVALLFGGFFVRFLAFFGGAFLSALPDATVRRLASQVPDGLAIALYISSTALFAHLLSYPHFVPVFLVATFVLVAKVTYGDGPLRRVFAWTPLRYLGNVSYSFYLVHGLAVELVMNDTMESWLAPRGLAYLVTTFAASLVLGIVAATALFVLAERPYFTWRRSAMNAARPTREIAVVGG
jgi:peptidoglycan/LPS O-acetylase OafA/YrhL